MLSNRARLALFDIWDNCELAEQFIAGLSFEDFKTDRRTFYAVTRALEMISEAARRLPPALRERHPHLPWRAIMGLGNLYPHDYDNVAEEFVCAPCSTVSPRARPQQLPSGRRRLRDDHEEAGAGAGEGGLSRATGDVRPN